MVKTRRFRGGKNSTRQYKQKKHHSTHRRKVKRYSRRGTKRRRRKRTKRVKRSGTRKSVMKGGGGNSIFVLFNKKELEAFGFTKGFFSRGSSGIESLKFYDINNGDEYIVNAKKIIEGGKTYNVVVPYVKSEVNEKLLKLILKIHDVDIVNKLLPDEQEFTRYTIDGKPNIKIYRLKNAIKKLNTGGPKFTKEKIITAAKKAAARAAAQTRHSPTDATTALTHIDRGNPERKYTNNQKAAVLYNKLVKEQGVDKETAAEKANDMYSINLSVSVLEDDYTNLMSEDVDYIDDIIRDDVAEIMGALAAKNPRPRPEDSDDENLLTTEDRLRARQDGWKAHA